MVDAAVQQVVEKFAQEKGLSFLQITVYVEHELNRVVEQTDVLEALRRLETEGKICSKAVPQTWTQANLSTGEKAPIVYDQKRWFA